MTPEQAAADLKALELKAAEKLVKEKIPKKYNNYKQEKMTYFGDQAYQYQTYLTSARRVVINNSDGKSSQALIDLLYQLIQEDSILLHGVASITDGIKRDYILSQLAGNIRLIDNSFENFSINSIISLLDEFLKSKNKLNSALPILDDLKVKNSQLLGDLEDIFEEVIRAIAAILPHVSYLEVRAIAVSNGFRPLDNIKLDLVKETDDYIVKATRLIKKTVDDVQRFYDDMHGVDDEMASKFDQASRWLVGNIKEPVGVANKVLGFIKKLSKGFDKSLKNKGAKAGKLLQGLAGGFKSFVDNPVVKVGGKILGVAGAVLEGLDTYNQDVDAGRSKEFAAVHGTTKAVAVTAGATIGASIGSIIPGVGTVIGGLVGGALGSLAASIAVDAGADAIEKNSSSAKNKPKPA